MHAAAVSSAKCLLVKASLCLEAAESDKHESSLTLRVEADIDWFEVEFLPSPLTTYVAYLILLHLIC